MTPKTWLFVGASGRVGRMLLRYWRHQPPAGLHVLAQSRDTTGAVMWSPLDGPEGLVDWVAQNGPIDGMFAFAGVTPAAGADLSLNAALVTASLAAADAAGIGRVLVASSSAIYGAGDGTAMDESAALAPANDYGRAKIAAETACQPWRDKGLTVSCLRIGNVVGADALLLNTRTATPEKPLRLDVFDDGRGPIRSYIAPGTMARVLETLALAQHLPAVLNLAAPQAVTMESLVAQTVAPWLGSPAPATAFQHITLDCSRLGGLFPFEPSDSDPKSMVADWQSLKDPE